MSKPENFDPKHIRPGRIRHGSLPPDLLEQIGAVFDEIGQFLANTLEQFEIGFMRDTEPERGVLIGASVTATWCDYCPSFALLDLRIFQVLSRDASEWRTPAWA